MVFLVYLRFGFLVEEVEESVSLEEEAAPAPIRAQCATYASTQREHLQATELEAESENWHETKSKSDHGHDVY